MNRRVRRAGSCGLTGLLIAAVAVIGGAAAPTAQAAATGIPNLAKGWDVDAAITADDVSCFKKQGFTFSLLYTNISETDWKTTYSALEEQGMQAILQNGFEDESLWSSAGNGTTTANSDVAAAQSVKYPQGSDFFMDVESTGSASENTVISWINNWATVIAAAGYVPGIYSGAPTPLTNADLSPSVLPKVKVYWQSESSSAADPAQGYVAVQDAPHGVGCRVDVDTDTAYIDKNNNHLYGSGGGGGTPTPVGTGPLLAIQANTHYLYTSNVAGSTTAKLTVAGQPGTSPAVGSLTTASRIIAYQGTSGNLFSYATSGAKATDLALPMKSGTSPAIAVHSSTAYAIALQGDSGNLWLRIGTTPSYPGPGMAAGTSPSITDLAGTGGYQVAVQANTGNLFTYNATTKVITDLGVIMRTGTSPSISALPVGGYDIAVQGGNGDLWIYRSGAGAGVDLHVPMMPSTSPGIAVLSGGDWVIAYQNADGFLHTYRSSTGGDTNLQIGLARTTGVTVLPVSGGDYVLAFQAANGYLYSWSSSNSVPVQIRLGMARGVTPGIG